MSSKKHKLLLINPLSTKRSGLIHVNDSIYPPMSLAIIAALTPDNWDIELLDENFEKFEFREADLVALTALTSQVTRAYEIAAVYQRKNIPTVIGGIHASVMPEEAKKYVDTIVIGEAESVWDSVIADYENNTLKKSYEGVLKSMVTSPEPRIDLYHHGYAFGSIQTTRGCPMSCDFCSVHTFNGKKYRPRAVNEVVDEFEKIPQDKVYFVDDNFIGYSTSSVNRVIEICKEIISRGIKKNWFCAASMNIAEHDEVLKLASEAGCRMIFLGIESELIDQLESTNKHMNLKIGVDNFTKVYSKLHKYGIAVLGAFIYGLDSDTPKTIANRTDYIINSGIDAMQTTVLTPLPGTPLFNRLKSEGRLIFDNFPEDWARYDFAEVVFNPGSMTNDELSKAINLAWNKLYEPRALKRRFIRSLKLTKNPISATWSYNSNLQYKKLVDEKLLDSK
jgi:radical SAM superfamily enzyme YgiQ (UPF0313 family)